MAKDHPTSTNEPKPLPAKEADAFAMILRDGKTLSLTAEEYATLRSGDTGKAHDGSVVTIKRTLSYQLEHHLLFVIWQAGYSAGNVIWGNPILSGPDQLFGRAILSFAGELAYRFSVRTQFKTRDQIKAEALSCVKERLDALGVDFTEKNYWVNSERVWPCLEEGSKPIGCDAYLVPRESLAPFLRNFPSQVVLANELDAACEVMGALWHVNEYTETNPNSMHRYRNRDDYIDAVASHYTWLERATCKLRAEIDLLPGIRKTIAKALGEVHRVARTRVRGGINAAKAARNGVEMRKKSIVEFSVKLREKNPTISTAEIVRQFRKAKKQKHGQFGVAQSIGDYEVEGLVPKRQKAVRKRS